MSSVAAEVLEHPLAAEAAHGVLADGVERVGLDASRRASTGVEAVDVAGGEGDDPAARGNAGRPCRAGSVFIAQVSGFLPGRAELHAGHVDDVGRVGQLVELRRVEQVAADRLDAVLLRAVAAARGIEKRDDADDAPADAGRVDCALRHARQRRPHLAADAEDDDVAVEPAHRLDDAAASAR